MLGERQWLTAENSHHATPEPGSEPVLKLPTHQQVVLSFPVSLPALPVCTTRSLAPRCYAGRRAGGRAGTQAHILSELSIPGKAMGRRECPSVSWLQGSPQFLALSSSSQLSTSLGGYWCPSERFLQKGFLKACSRLRPEKHR